jgi:hypothetical protein
MQSDVLRRGFKEVRDGSLGQPGGVSLKATGNRGSPIRRPIIEQGLFWAFCPKTFGPKK